MFWIVTISSIAFLGACSPTKQVIEKESQSMWMDSTTSFAIGRFVLERPSDFVILSQTYKFDGNNIKTSFKKSLPEFNYVVAKREKYLREKKREGSAESEYAETNLAWLEDGRSPKKDTGAFNRSEQHLLL